MSGSFSAWEAEEERKESWNASLAEVASLSNLVTFEIDRESKTYFLGDAKFAQVEDIMF